MLEFNVLFIVIFSAIILTYTFFFLIFIVTINDYYSNFGQEYLLTAWQNGLGAFIISGVFVQMISTMTRFWEKRQNAQRGSKGKEDDQIRNAH